MKNFTWILTLVATSAALAQDSPLADDAGSFLPPSQQLLSRPATLAESGPNHRVWQRVAWQTNQATHTARPIIHSYTEIQPGANHLLNGRLVESTPQIYATPTGAAATNTQHLVAFLGNINAQGAVSLTTPEGKHLVSNILGLSYWDTASGHSVFIAETKDAPGQLSPSGNQAIYADAFSGVLADVLYENQIGKFEQIVVLRQQLPDPAQWQLDPRTTVFQVITEFLSPPEPNVVTIPTEAGPDDHLDFGIMQVIRGEAFALGVETNRVPVTKKWLVLDGRQCLVEQVHFAAIEPLLQNLPPAASTLRPKGQPGPILAGTPLHRLPSKRTAMPSAVLATTS